MGRAKGQKRHFSESPRKADAAETLLAPAPAPFNTEYSMGDAGFHVGELPRFRRPIVTRCRLPVGLVFFHARRPNEAEEMKGAAERFPLLRLDCFRRVAE